MAARRTVGDFAGRSIKENAAGHQTASAEANEAGMGYEKQVGPIPLFVPAATNRF
jgi:hypothetical protein